MWALGLPGLMAKPAMGTSATTGAIGLAKSVTRALCTVPESLPTRKNFYEFAADS